MKVLLLAMGILLAAAYIAGLIMVVHTNDMLRAAWYAPNDNTYWDAYLIEHTRVWMTRASVVLTVGLALPSAFCFAFGLKRKPRTGQFWKRNSSWTWIDSPDDHDKA